VFGIFIDGTVVRGFQVARETLEKQIPLVAAEFPEIQYCYRGSINLKLECGLRIDHPDHRTRPIDWGDPTPEVFGFLRVSIQFPCDGPAFRAWIYVPYNSPHLSDPSHVEIIAEQISGIEYGALCRLQIPTGRYESFAIAVV
jgi:hypothetical protein